MKEMVRYGFILALICTVAAGLLASMNLLTNYRILAQARTEEEAALREVMPEGIEFNPVKFGNEVIYYQAYGAKKELIGAVFKASGKGYSSTIETMVGMFKDGMINTIKILSQNETPGLGIRITEPAFTGRFSRKNIQGLADIQAISGATISSKAVMDSVRKKAEEIQSLIKDER